MKIQCNSCQKSFLVPNNAITAKGRLVQCSSCGNKWVQLPVKEVSTKVEEISKIKEVVTSTKNQNLNKKKVIKKRKNKKNPDTYSPEYLQKKHGIKIIDPSSISSGEVNKEAGDKIPSYGFYNYIITLTIFVVTFYGILNLTKDMVIMSYPNLEDYIIYLFEAVNNIKIIISDLIANY